MRDSAIIYEAFYLGVQRLSPEDQAEAYNAYCRMTFYGEDYTGDNIAISVLLDALRPKIEKAESKYQSRVEETSKARSEAGKKGAMARWQTMAKMANDGKNGNDIDMNCNDIYINPPIIPPSEEATDKKPEKKPKRKTASEINTELLQTVDGNPAYLGILADWMAYKAERGESYKAAGFKALVTQFDKHTAEAGLDSVRDVVTTSMGNHYQGIIWDRLRKDKPPNRFNDFAQRPGDPGDVVSSRLMDKLSAF